MSSFKEVNIAESICLGVGFGWDVIISIMGKGVCLCVFHMFLTWLIAVRYQAGDIELEHVYQYNNRVHTLLDSPWIRIDCCSVAPPSTHRFCKSITTCLLIMVLQFLAKKNPKNCWFLGHLPLICGRSRAGSFCIFYLTNTISFKQHLTKP